LDELVGDDACDLLCLDLEKAERLRRERIDTVRASRLAEPELRTALVRKGARCRGGSRGGGVCRTSSQ
jgi:hypothetical protein